MKLANSFYGVKCFQMHTIKCEFFDSRTQHPEIRNHIPHSIKLGVKIIYSPVKDNVNATIKFRRWITHRVLVAVSAFMPGTGS